MTDPFPDDTLRALALYLLHHLAALRQHPAAADAFTGITRATWRAQRAIDRPPGRTYAGPCQSCGADLLAAPGRAEVTCALCNQLHNVAAQQAWMRDQLEDFLGSAPWVATAVTGLGLVVTPERVRLWASRHRLQVRGYGPPRTPGGQPVPLYRVGDVVQLAFARDMARPA